MSRSSQLRMVLAGGAAILLLVACSSDDGDDGGSADSSQTEGSDEGEGSEEGDGETGGGLPALPELTEVNVGYVSAVDQMGAAIGLDIGFYDELNLDVTLAEPFASGGDALQALEAGDVDYVQVGSPSWPAILEGMDLVYLGNYSGSSSQLGIDETMAMVATEDSGIDPDDWSTIEGKTIGVTFGSINQLYLLGLLEQNEIDPESVTMENVPPPDMGPALQSNSIDAAVAWDPWPITWVHDVDGAVEVSRGEGYIAYVGYIVSTREYAENNPEAVEAFLTARAAADNWMRENPEEAADVTTRWIPGTDIEVAEEAMQYNIIQLDPRFSACNYLAMETMQQLLVDLGANTDAIDPNDHFMPGPILSVMEAQPQLFDDLPEIPEEAQITAGYEYTRNQAQDACPS